MEHVWICGAGDLGWRVACRLNLNVSPKKITLETLTDKRHLEYFQKASELGYGNLHFLDSHNVHKSTETCRHLLISIPPYGDYINSVEKALKRWDGTGTAILVSSTGVYAENSGDWVDFESPVKDSDQTRAERISLDVGAHVVRLAGLYDRGSGAHRYWQMSGKSSESPNGFINLIHRDDAAAAVAVLLATQHPPRVWNLSDGSPLTRSEIAKAWTKICGVEVEFSPDSKNLGKKLKVDSGWGALSFIPQHASFLEFCMSQPSHRDGGGAHET